MQYLYHVIDKVLFFNSAKLHIFSRFSKSSTNLDVNLNVNPYTHTLLHHYTISSGSHTSHQW